MKFKMIIAALVLVISNTAAADFVTIQDAYEIALDNVRLPHVESGTIAFRKCDDCPYETKRLASGVAWRINGKDTTFRKFIAQVSELYRDDEIITVLHHLEHDNVTRVSVWVR